MKPGQRDIYYLAAPSRQLAESSPYFEALREKDVEILFCYEPYDELVLMQLQQFDKVSFIYYVCREGGWVRSNAYFYLHGGRVGQGICLLK